MSPEALRIWPVRSSTPDSTQLEAFLQSLPRAGEDPDTQ